VTRAADATIAAHDSGATERTSAAAAGLVAPAKKRCRTIERKRSSAPDGSANSGARRVKSSTVSAGVRTAPGRVRSTIFDASCRARYATSERLISRRRLNRRCIEGLSGYWASGRGWTAARRQELPA
jgi:hypothetical protein